MTEDQLRGIVANLADVGEDLHHEFKEAAGGLPHDLWETYSAFANTEGGVIVLGVREDITPHALEPVGVKDAPSLVKSIWDTLGNPKRVSADVLAPSGVCVAEYEGKTFVAIDVPRADRYARPVSVYDKRRKGLVPFVRRGESDRVAEGEMMRILSYDSMPDADGRPLLDFDLEALNRDTIHRYRTVFAALRDQHPWAREPVEDFLSHTRCAARRKRCAATYTGRSLGIWGFVPDLCVQRVLLLGLPRGEVGCHTLDRPLSLQRGRLERKRD